MIELLTTNHMEKILDLFDGTQKDIKIISPFLTMSMAEILCSVVKTRSVSCTFITRFYMEDMVAKANSIDALELMMNSGIDVYAVKGLHTKLYLFDSDNAILGSANFTNGGFKSNVELSLLVSEEQPVIKELHAYFDDMAGQLKTIHGSRVTRDMIDKARSIYMDLFNAKKGTIKTRSAVMFGAALNRKAEFKTTQSIWTELDTCEKEHDLICDMFRETEQVEQVKYPFNIWLKFDGEGNDRLKADEGFPMIDVAWNGGTVYLSNYPFKVWSVKEDDEIYLAALTTDKRGKKQPVIVGRGHLAAFSDKNVVNEAMLQRYEWMERYPWYCVIKDCEILDTTVNSGIPMDAVWDALGSDTYIASFGRHEGISAVARKHYQKAHIRLSGNAKDYIDKQLDELKAQYGVILYHSAL